MKTLYKRTLSGLVFMPIMVCGIILHPLAYALLFSFCIAVMVIEFYHICVGKENPLGQVFGFAASLALFVGAYLLGRHGMGPGKYVLASLALLLSGVWISSLYDKSSNAYRNTAFLFLPLLYIALPFALCNFIVFTPSPVYDGSVLLALFIILWASDVGGYVLGMLFGQKHGHKLFPRISPKKSWEGFVGSVLFSVGASAILYVFQMLPFALYHCLILGGLICVFGVWGDLTESALKRYAGVKDAGTIMPGHGGLLDRFDGALLAFPVAVVYIMFVIK